MTMVARLEGGIALIITDCEDTLSPVAWHRDGRAKGFYVGVYRTTQDADGADIDWTNQFASAYNETSAPTAEAIGDLICKALKNAAIILSSTTKTISVRAGQSSPSDSFSSIEVMVGIIRAPARDHPSPSRSPFTEAHHRPQKPV